MLDWIKCEDRLPEDERTCICWIENECGKSVGFGFYTNNLSKEYNGEYKWVVNDYVHEDVVAWAEFNKYR